MVNHAGDKRKKSELDSPAASPPPLSDGSGCGSNNEKGGDGGDDGGGDGGCDDGGKNESCSQPSPPATSSAPPARCHHHPSSSAAAYTDYSSVPEPCALEDVLAVNAKSSSPRHRREMNEASIRRRGGAPEPENEDGSGGGGRNGGGGGGRGNFRRGPCSHATFPAKLHDILSRPDLADVVGWLPHGRSWRIVDQTAFINRVMPHFFTQSKFASFMRQVNGWGFARVTRGDEVNSYYSEFFLRGKRSLARYMERKPAVRDMLGPEPNFAEYEILPPNPEVDPRTLVPLPPVSSAALPNGTAGAGKAKGDKRRRGVNEEKSEPVAPSGAKSDAKNEDVGETEHHSNAPNPSTLGGSVAGAAVLDGTAALQPAPPYFQQHNLARLPNPSQQFASQQPPHLVLQQQALLHRHPIQQQQVAFQVMPQGFPHPITKPMSGGATMTMMPYAQNTTTIINPEFPQQVAPRINGSGGLTTNPHAFANAMPQQLPQTFPQGANVRSLMSPLLPSMQQQGTNNGISSSWPSSHAAMSVNVPSNARMNAISEQQSQQQQQVQFNAPHNQCDLTMRMQSVQFSPSQKAALQQQVQQQQMQQQQVQPHGLQQQQMQQQHIQQQEMQQHSANLGQQSVGMNTWGMQQDGSPSQQQLGCGATPVQLPPRHSPTELQQQQQLLLQGAENFSAITRPQGMTAAPNSPSALLRAPAQAPMPGAGLPQTKPLGQSPTLASAPAMPTSVPMQTSLEALMNKGGTVPGPGTRTGEMSRDVGNDNGIGDTSPSLASTDRTGAGRDETNAAVGVWNSNSEDHPVVGSLSVGEEGSEDEDRCALDAVCDSVGGDSEMEDMDITGMIAGDGNTFGGILGDTGLISGSLDDIW